MTTDNDGAMSRGSLALPAGVSALLRLIDDSLCVSTNSAVSHGFVSALKRGIEPYGCHAQLEKTRALPVHEQGLGASPRAQSGARSAASPVRDGHGRRFFNWCGLLLNVQSCEVQSDLCRRSGAHTLSSGTRQPARLRASALASKMRAAIKNKLVPIFIDPQLNSSLTVRRNVLHALAYAISLGLACTRWVLARRQPAIALCTVAGLIRYTSSMTRRYQRRCVLMQPNEGGDIDLPSTMLEHLEVRWLGWAALVMVLPTSCVGVSRAAASRQERLERVGASQLTPEALVLLREAASARGLTVGCL